MAPPWTPPTDAEPVSQKPAASAFTPPADAEVIDDSKKKDLSASTLSSTPQAQVSGLQFPSASQTPASGSPSTNPLIPGGGNDAFSPKASITQPQSYSTTGSQIPFGILSRNPLLSHADIQNQQSAAPKVQSAPLGTLIQTPDTGIQAMQAQVVDLQLMAENTGDQIEKAGQQYYNKLVSYNAAVQTDQQKQLLLEQQPGTPEYNSKNFPGVALPVASEPTMDKFDRYYRSYLAQYEPQKLHDHEQTIAGQMAQQQHSAFTTVDENQKVSPIQYGETETLNLQKTQAQFDQQALNFAGMGAASNFNTAAAALDANYKAEMNAATKLNQWPKNTDSSPLLNNHDDELNYQSLTQQLKDNPGFLQTFSQAAVSKAHLDEVRQAGQGYLDKYPQWRDQFNLVNAVQKEVNDPITGQGWITGNIINPAIRTITSAVESFAYLPKIVGSDDYGWTDALYDSAKMNLDTKASVLFPTSGTVSTIENPYTGEQQQIFKEDLMPRFVSGMTQMGLIIAGGQVPAALGGTAEMGKVALVGSAAVASMNQFYDAAIGAGMDEQDAKHYSEISGIVSGLFMAVNPTAITAVESNSIIGKSVQQYITTLATQGSTSAARQTAMKSLVTDMVGMNAVGIAQKFSDYGTNYLANTVTGANLDTGKNIGSDMWDTAVMSTLMGGAFGAIHYGNDIVGAKPEQSQPYLESLYTAAKDPQRYKDALLRMQTAGTISPDKLQYLGDQINKATSALETAPESLTPQQKAMMLPELMRKQDLLAQLKVTDGALKPVVESQIAESDSKIRDIAGIKTPEEIAIANNQEEQDRIEHQDLILESAALGGDLPEEKLSRLQELENKFNPQESYTQNQSGLSGQERGGQEPQQAEFVEEGGGEAPETSGILQTSSGKEEIVPLPGKKLFNEPNPETATIAESYMKKSGIESQALETVSSINVDAAKRVADQFQEMKNDPENPEVKRSYEKMVSETNDQAKSILDAGYKIEIYEGDTDPYASSADMIKDLKDNKHLFVLSTEKGFGEERLTDEMRQKDILLNDSGMKDINGKTLLNNDVFRFVHDFFGHPEKGNAFGPIGEENAWLIHSRMYSDEARRAMTTETKGQNSWVNFGEHMRNPDGTLKTKGDEGYLPPQDRPYAEQKMGLLPDEIVFPERQNNESIGHDETTTMENQRLPENQIPEKRSNVNPSGPKATDIEDIEVVKEDNPEILDRLDKDLEATKQVSLGKIDVKRKAVEGRIKEAVDNKMLTTATGEAYLKAVRDVADARKESIKKSVNQKIDTALNATKKFLKDKNIIGGDIIGPDEKTIKVIKNGLLDVERLLDKTADILKAAVSKGIDLNIAINNMMAAIKSHPAFKALSDQDKNTFEQKVRENFEKSAVQMKDEIDALDKAQGKTVSRALESPFVDENVKNELKRLGTDYIPQKNKIAEQDARRIVEFFKDSGERDKLEEAVKDLGNGMQLDSRGAIMVELIKDYTAQSKETRTALDKASTPEEIAAATLSHQEIADKLAALTHHAGNIGTIVGRYMQYVHKALKNIFESAPQDIVRSMIDEQVKLRAKEISKDNESKILSTVSDINGKIIDGKISDEEIIKSIDKNLPHFSEENKTELIDSIKKAVEEKGKLDKSSLSNTYESVLGKEIMNPATKKIVDDNISRLNEYDDKVSAAKSKINEYKSTVESEKTAYADAVKNGTEVSKEEQKKLSDNIDLAHTDALNAAKEMETFRLRAQEAQENIMKELRPPRNIWNTMGSMMTGNMLRIKSLAVNMLAYIPTIAMRGIGGTIGSMADWIEVKSFNAFSKITGSDKSIERSVNILAQIEGAAKYGAAPGHQEAFRRVLTGSMSSDLGKLEGHSTINFVDAWKDLVAKRSPAENKFFENRASAALEATIGVPADIIFRLLQLGDAPPRTMAEKGKLFEMGKDKGLDQADLLNFMFFPDEQSANIAKEFGKKATYQQTNIVSDKVRGLMHVFSTMAEQSGNRHLAGAIRLAETTVTPFVKTPINIIGEVLTYSNPGVPLIMTAMKIKDSIKAAKNGNMEAANRYRGEANMYFAKTIIGTAIASLAYSYVTKGLMTPGYNREDSESEKLAREEGVKYNSMNVSAFNRMMAGNPDWQKVQKDDYWMNYGKMGSFGMVLSVWAETITDKNTPVDGSGLPESTLSLMANAGLNTVSVSFDQSFLTGTSTLMDAMHSKNYDQIIPNTLMAFTNIALPGTVMDISKSQNDAQKITASKGNPVQTYENKLKLGTFQGDQLQDKVGLFGETLSSAPRGTTPVIYNVADPFGFYQPGGDNVTSKVIDFYTSIPPNTEGRNKILPAVPSQTIQVNGQSVMLTDQEYHDFKVMVGNARAAYVTPYMGADFQNDDYNSRIDMLSSFYKDGYKDAYWNFIETTPRLKVIDSGVPQ